MRLDINISAPPPPGDDEGSATRAAQLAAQMGHLLARMEFDYPTQMIARVKVDNDDGTYDCDRPGTSIYMSRVETISPQLTQQIAVGMTVLIRFFRRDRNKPYIVRVAGGLVKQVETDIWSRFSGNRFNSFRSLVSTAAFGAIAGLTPTTLASDHSGVNFGAGSVLVAYPSGDRTILAVLTETTGSGQVVFACDVADPAGFSWVTAALPALSAPQSPWGIGDLGFVSDHRQNVFGLHYHAGTDRLLVVHRVENSLFVDGKDLNWTRVLALAASDGEILLDKVLTGNLTDGCMVCGDLLVGLPASWAYDLALRRMDRSVLPAAYSATPGASSVSQGCIQAYNISDLEQAWEFDFYSLCDAGEAYPLIYSSARIRPTAIVHSLGCGLSPAYGRDSNKVFFAASVRNGIPMCNTAGTYPASFSVANIIPTNFPFAVPLDNQPTRGSASDLNQVSPDAYTVRAWIGALDKDTGALVATYEFPKLDARDEANYMIDSPSFNLSLNAGYLSATNTNPGYTVYNNYQDFETRTQSARGIPAHGEWDLSTGTLATSGHPSLDPFRPMIGSIVGPNVDTTSTNWAAAGGAPYQGRVAANGGQQYLFPHYETWPATAGYHFDSCPLILRLPAPTETVNPPGAACPIATWSAGAAPFSVGSANQSLTDMPDIVLDEDENLYIHYLQPVNVISARYSNSGNVHAFHRIISASMPTGLAGGVARPAYPGNPGTGGSIEIEWCGFPYRYTMYRSFLLSLTSGLTSRWSQETTKRLTDSVNSSGLSLPFGSHVFRMIPVDAGIYVLRTERVTFASMPILYNSAAYVGQTKATQDLLPRYSDRTGDHEPLVWAKLLLEFRSKATGAVIWTQTLWDPEAVGITTPTCVPAAYLYTDGTNVHGRFDRATATWGSSGSGLSYANYSLSSVVGTMFDCTPEGTVTTRAATATDPVAAGINSLAGLTRVNACHAVIDGELYFNNHNGTKWVISKF